MMHFARCGITAVLLGFVIPGPVEAQDRADACGGARLREVLTAPGPYIENGPAVLAHLDAALHVLVHGGARRRPPDRRSVEARLPKGVAFDSTALQWALATFVVDSRQTGEITAEAAAEWFRSIKGSSAILLRTYYGRGLAHRPALVAEAFPVPLEDVGLDAVTFWTCDLIEMLPVIDVGEWSQRGHPYASAVDLDVSLLWGMLPDSAKLRIRGWLADRHPTLVRLLRDP